MSTPNFLDRFDRVDALSLDSTVYTVPCGQVGIFDESVLPIAESVTGESPFGPGVDEKTQVLYTEDTLDNPHQVVRCVWGHDDVTPTGVVTPPSFTILARMTKDPLILSLGGDEEPFCYDQGYGLRVTCPLDGSAPVLKLIKFMPARRAPDLPRPSSAEPDGAQVLASVTLSQTDMNIDPEWNNTGEFPYRGFWQDMRLRLRHTNDQVVLDAFLNDVHLNTPILTFIDRRDPVWSEIGVPGFEFISAVLTPLEGSPFEQDSKSLMRCTLFSVDTLKVMRRPQLVTPANAWTYQAVIDRVITHVEKNGDAKFTATLAGLAKIRTYLDFIAEAEMAICRREGYWHWLKRRGRIYLADGQDVYELPEDCAKLEFVKPGSWPAMPLRQVTELDLLQRTSGQFPVGGFPCAFYMGEENVNNRGTIVLLPTPALPEEPEPGDEPPFLEVIYYARPVRPPIDELDRFLPTIPQEHMDVLIYSAAAHALLLDTDPQNAEFYVSAAGAKLGELVRENNRMLGTDRLVMRSAADIYPGLRGPITRAESLGFGWLR